jgi:hypothetical protein
MAQYLPYIPETIPEPALYKPDFNFYDRMLQRKQSMFEQGASRVRSAYTSVLNAPLSNKNLIPLRDQYIKDAQEQLTKLSSSDLSLMENVNAAEQIFSPFWQNKFMVQDIAMTKSYQNEMQKYQSWKDSAKPEEREKYNNIGMMYLQNGLSKLQNAELTPEAFGAIEMRKAEPFTNIEAYLDKIAAQEKLQVKYDDPNGPYLIETVNGERSKQKYAVWAASRIGNNFQGQFEVTGTVENEERAKILKRNNPNLTEPEIQSLIAKDVVSELNTGFTKRNQEIDVELARIDSLLSSIGETGGSNNQAMFNKLVEERSELMGRKAAIGEEYKYFDKEKSKVLEAVTAAPKQYFSVLAKQRLINNWATGTASIDQKLIKENVAYTSAQGLDLRRAEHNLAVNSAAFDQWYKTEELKIKAAKGPTVTNPVTGTGLTTNTDGVVVPGVDESGSLVYSGLSGIDITKTAETAFDVYSKNQKQAFLDAHNLIFDQKGILGFASKLGLNPAEIAHVATALQAEISSDYKHDYTKEQSAAANKLNKALLNSQGVKTAGITSITGPSTFRNALIAYAGDYLSERSKVAADGSDIPLSNTEFEALMRYSTAVTKLDSYNANEAQRKKLVQDKLQNDPNYKGLLVDVGNGEKDLVTSSNIADKFKGSYDFEDEDGNKVKLTKDDLAKAYISGNVTNYVPTFFQNMASSSAALAGGGNTTTYMGYTVKKDDKEYHLFGRYSSGPGYSNNSIPTGLNDLRTIIGSLNTTYKSSQDLVKNLKAAHESVVPDLLMYKNLTGQQGSLFALIPKGNKTMGDRDNPDNAVKVIYQAAQSGNLDEIYDKDGEVIEDADKINAIRTLLSSEKNIEEYVSGQYIPQGVNGKRTVRVIFSKPLSEETKDQVGGVNLGGIGTEFNFVLKDNTAGTYLDQLPNNTGFQVYDAITRGKQIKSDPILDAAGFSYTITPNVMSDNGSAVPQYVSVDLKYKVRSNVKDPQTGQLTTKVEDKSYFHTINLQGDGAKSPDEIVSYLQSLYLQNMNNNRNLQLEYQKFSNTNVSGTTWDPKAALQAAGLGHLIK